MMKRAIAILMAIMLCMTFIACSNQPVTQPTLESGETVMSELVSATSGNEDDSDGNDTVHSEKPTENSTPSTTTVTEDVVTSEKEKDETKPSATHPSTEDIEQNDPPKETEESSPPKVTTTDPVEETDASTVPETEMKTEQSEETKPQPQPEETKPVEQPSTYDIERLVAQYINQYRADQGSSSATILPGLTEVARYRARQLVSDFSHNSNPNPCTVLQYGEYIDMTLFGGDATESYYRGYNREAIGKGDWFGTADQMAQRIASGFKKSSKHWAYVGDSEYSYMAVGVHYNESDGKWYCSIINRTDGVVDKETMKFGDIIGLRKDNCGNNVHPYMWEQSDKTAYWYIPVSVTDKAKIADTALEYVGMYQQQDMSVNEMQFQ